MTASKHEHSETRTRTASRSQRSSRLPHVSTAIVQIALQNWTGLDRMSTADGSEQQHQHSCIIIDHLVVSLPTPRKRYYHHNTDIEKSTKTLMQGQTCHNHRDQPRSDQIEAVRVFFAFVQHDSRSFKFLFQCYSFRKVLRAAVAAAALAMWASWLFKKQSCVHREHFSLKSVYSCRLSDPKLGLECDIRDRPYSLPERDDVLDIAGVACVSVVGFRGMTCSSRCR